MIAVTEEKSERDKDGEALVRAVNRMKEANDREAERRRAEKEAGA